MDKTLEIVMVAMALIIAAVIVIGLLQGQVDMFGGFSENQTESSGCGISRTQFANAVDCSASSSGDIKPARADDIADKNSQCEWASDPYNNVC